MNSTPQLFKSFITKDPSEIYVKIPSSTWSPSISLEIDELENSLACRVGKKASCVFWNFEHLKFVEKLNPLHNL